MAIGITVNAQVYQFPKVIADENPFARRSEIKGNSELFFIYDSLAGGNYFQNQRIYDFISGPPSNLAWLARDVYNGAPNNHGSRHMAVAAGDFNGDYRDNVVVAWEDTNQQIIITIPNIPSNLNVNGYTQVINPGPLAIPSGATFNGRLRLATGDFDGDGKSEFVIAYRNRNDQMIHLDVYDVDSATFSMTLIASIADEILPQSAIVHECYDIAARDLDADGIPEIVLASAQYTASNKYMIYDKIYLASQGPPLTLTPKAKTVIDSTSIDNSDALNVAVGIADLNGDISPEIITVYGHQGMGFTDTWMRITRPADDSLTNPLQPDWLELMYLVPAYDSASFSVNELETFCIVTGDINQDGHDDLVIGLSDYCSVYTIDSVFNFIPIGSPLGTAQNHDYHNYDSYTTIGDINQDGKLDIINVRNQVVFGPPDYQSFYIVAHTLNAAGTGFDILANNDDVWNYTFSSANEIRQFAIVAGDFNGDKIGFRPGKKFIVSNVIQPLVTLNAPPIHFDFVPDTSTIPFDICQCFPNPVSNCQFYSTYTQASSTSLTLETQFTSDWSVSSLVGLPAIQIGPVGIKGELELTYGSKFTKTNSKTITIKTTQGSSAYFDDQYYATVATYIVWEYPVYVGDTLICYVTSVVPKSTNDLWVSASALPAGDGFYSRHEPGNILSYRPSNTAKEVSDSIFGNSGWVISQTLGPKNIGISLGQISSSMTGSTYSFSLKVAAEAGALGAKVGMSGQFQWETMSTQTVTAQNDIDISSYVNSRSGVGGDYTIIPYFGWGLDGAITLDYKVDPSGPWWNQYYAAPDPALLLPLHNFPEMGYTLPPPQDEYRIRTKSLTLNTRNPQSGNTVKMLARVFNYSILPMTDSIEVRFYYGDPDAGGIPISDLDGNTSAYTKILPDQYLDSVYFEFAFIPPPNNYDNRIFVVLDPSNNIQEVHENNNKGWIEMGIYFPLNLAVDENLTNPGLTLWPLWPNPVKDIAILKVDIHKSDHLLINLYDGMGKFILNVTNAEYNIGENLFSMDVSGLSNGIYFYSVTLGEITNTYKMVVIH